MKNSEWAPCFPHTLKRSNTAEGLLIPRIPNVYSWWEVLATIKWDKSQSFQCWIRLRSLCIPQVNTWERGGGGGGMQMIQMFFLWEIFRIALQCYDCEDKQRFLYSERVQFRWVKLACMHSTLSHRSFPHHCKIERGVPKLRFGQVFFFACMYVRHWWH